MAQRWQRAKKLPLFAEAGMVTLACRVALSLVPFQTIYRSLPRPVAQRQSCDAAAIVAAVARVSRWIPGARCLAQAVAAHVVLARHGYPSTVHIGVRPEQSHDLAAHAWLTTADAVGLGAGGSETFVPLVRVDARDL